MKQVYAQKDNDLDEIAKALGRIASGSEPVKEKEGQEERPVIEKQEVIITPKLDDSTRFIRCLKEKPRELLKLPDSQVVEVCICYSSAYSDKNFRGTRKRIEFVFDGEGVPVINERFLRDAKSLGLESVLDLSSGNESFSYYYRLKDVKVIYKMNLGI
jgi:hypothetical protein